MIDLKLMAKSKNKNKGSGEKSVDNNTVPNHTSNNNSDSIFSKEQTIKLLDEKTKYQIGALFAKNWNL